MSSGTASDVSASSVTLSGSLDDLGGASSTDCAFEYRQAGASSWSKTTTETLSSTGSFSATVTGLQEATDYECRAVAAASDGDTDTGSTVTFTTQTDSVAVSTGGVSTVDTSSATLPGSLDDLGGASSADCGFEYREVGASTWTATTEQTLSTTGSFSTSVSGLSDGTDYEYRAVAAASDGDTDTGTTRSFTTETASTESSPVVESYDVTEDGSANPHAEISANWSVTDADGDLDVVSVIVTDDSGQMVDYATTNVTGSSESSYDYFRIKRVRGQTFDVTLTVVDDADNSTSMTETVTE